MAVSPSSLANGAPPPFCPPPLLLLPSLRRRKEASALPRDQLAEQTNPMAPSTCFHIIGNLETVHD